MKFLDSIVIDMALEDADLTLSKLRNSPLNVDAPPSHVLAESLGQRMIANLRVALNAYDYTFRGSGIDEIGKFLDWLEKDPKERAG